MKNLVPYKLFEGVKELHPNAKEFMSELDKYPYKDVLTSWIKFTPRNTGRIAFSGHYIPSQAYVEKSANDRDWYYVYAAAGNYYGHQNGSLQELFPKMMKDFIKKGAPSYLNKKDLESILNDDAWFFDNIEIDYKDFYKKIQQKINAGSDIVLDFSNLKLPVLDNLDKLGLISVDMDGSYGQILVTILTPGYSSKTSLGDFWNFAKGLADSQKSNEEVRIDLNKFRTITFYPKGSGVSPRSTNERMKIDIGFKTEEECADMIQKTLIKYMLKNKIVFKVWRGENAIPENVSSLVNDLYHALIKGAASEISDDSMYTPLDAYFKKNPLDLYLLNPLPKMKAGVLKRTGIKDLSRIGDAMSRNFI